MSEEHGRKNPPAGKQGGQNDIKYLNNDEIHFGEDVNIPNVINLDRTAIAALTGSDRDKVEIQLVEKAASFEDDPLKQEKVINYACESLGVGRRPFQKAVKNLNEGKRQHALISERQENRNIGKIDLSEPAASWTKAVYEAIADEVFYYSGNLCRLIDGKLHQLSSAEIVSFVDNPRRCILMNNKKGSIRSSQFTECDARILRGAYIDNRDILRNVEVVSNVPVLALCDGQSILVNDYCHRTHILANGNPIKLPTPEEGVASLCNLFRDYDFCSEGDMGRAIAFFITPALSQGGFLGEGRTPFFLVEKNTNNAGGSLMIKIICAIYGLKAKPINRVDNPDKAYEQISNALLAGDGIIYFDNVRGNGLQKLPFLESLLTEPYFNCRIPYRQGEADVTRRVLAVSSNGATFSPDLASRTVKISIRKRPDSYLFYEWVEGGILEHILMNRERYLGAIYSLIESWVIAGRPPGRDLTGFRYPQWEKAVVWILQNNFPGLPLLEYDHHEAQSQLSDPDHDLLRNLFRLVIEGETKGELSATSLAEIAVESGLLESDVKQTKFRLGKALTRRFLGDGEHVFDSGQFKVFVSTRKNQQKSHDVRFYTISAAEEGNK